MTAPIRTSCSVPFCQRTVKGRWAHWMCRDHWRLVDRELKQLRSALRRKYVQLGEVEKVEGGQLWTSVRAWRAVSGLHRRMAQQAFERAAGISA